MSFTPKTASKESRVMRTVYLPVEMDRTLRRMAMSLGVSQAELISRMVGDELKKVGSCLSPPSDLEKPDA